MKRRIFALIGAFLALSLLPALAQEPGSAPVEVDYNNPQSYVVGGIRISGTKYLGESQLLSVLGIRPGDHVTVPGDVISSAVKRIWLQGAASTLGFYVDSLSAGRDTAWFRLDIQERPRVVTWNYRGVKNSERDDLKEKLQGSTRRGAPLSDYVKASAVKTIKDYFKEKGFADVDVDVEVAADSIIRNAVRVTFDVKKGKKLKIKEISYEGNDEISKFKLDKAMKKTKDAKWYNLFSSKKFQEKEYAGDKEKMLEVFTEAGYRDAKIVSDSLYRRPEDGKLGIHFKIDKGRKYYFRNITWTGNSEYSEDDLNRVLRIKKGDVYDVVTMEKRLYSGEKEGDISIRKMYSDNGFLFFNVVPVEMNIDGDSVDVEMRIVEGKPATFNNIIINGNNITNEKVVRRAVFTRPGYLYRQSDFERSVREISSMGHFDPEYAVDPNKGYNLIPNSMNNTVDIAYNVQEKPNSQLELSGGWGNRMFVGTVGVSFNNFSTANFFNKEAWRPVPLGDAQNLAIRQETDFPQYLGLFHPADELLFHLLLPGTQRRPVHGDLWRRHRHRYAPEVARQLLRALQFAQLAVVQPAGLELLLHLLHRALAQHQLVHHAIAQLYRPVHLSAYRRRPDARPADHPAVVPLQEGLAQHRLQQPVGPGPLPLDRIPQVDLQGVHLYPARG